jgi:hypothetical protein
VTAVRVYVGTTDGPAEIQRITEEPTGIRSVVCLDGKAVALPISADYDSFVRRPTGVVEKLFGHSAFRLDVGARITDGLSWQLAALLAHSLHAAGRLAAPAQPAETVVWATGEVDAALAVRPVEAVARKLRTSADLLRGLTGAGTKILVLVPRAAEAEARTTLAELQLGPSCRLVPVATAGEAFAALDAPRHGALAVPTPEPPPRPSRRRGLWVAAAVPALGVAGALAALAATWREPVAAWQRLADAGDLMRLESTLAAAEATPRCLTCGAVAKLFRDRLAAARPAASAIRVEATAYRVHRFGDCGDPAQIATQPVARTEGGDFAPSSADGLCEVRYRASGAPYVALILFPGGAAGGEPGWTSSIGATTPEVTAVVSRWRSSPMENRLIVVAAANPLEPLLADLPRPDRGAATPSPDDLLNRLAVPSVLVFEVRHTIAR